MQHNLDRANLSNEHQTRQSIMTREIKQLRTEKKQQVCEHSDRADMLPSDFRYVYLCLLKHTQVSPWTLIKVPTFSKGDADTVYIILVLNRKKLTIFVQFFLVLKQNDMNLCSKLEMCHYDWSMSVSVHGILNSQPVTARFHSLNGYDTDGGCAHAVIIIMASYIACISLTQWRSSRFNIQCFPVWYVDKC